MWWFVGIVYGVCSVWILAQVIQCVQIYRPSPDYLLDQEARLCAWLKKRRITRLFAYKWALRLIVLFIIFVPGKLTMLVGLIVVLVRLFW